MESPELKFKRIFDIRWSSIRDCIKPIIINIQPGFAYPTLAQQYFKN